MRYKFLTAVVLLGMITVAWSSTKLKFSWRNPDYTGPRFVGGPDSLQATLRRVTSS